MPLNGAIVAIRRISGRAGWRFIWFSRFSQSTVLRPLHSKTEVVWLF